MTIEPEETTGRLEDAAAVHKIANRLKRAQGQLAAVSSALDRAGFAIVSTALRQCITDETPSDQSGTTGGRGKLTLDELERLFLTLA
jgi:DNA-binding FrmR family transcriptional regulator